MDAVMEPFGEGWRQLGELALALLFSSAIGLERELKMRSAGLRTCSLIGIAAALITLVSKYGFTDVLQPGHVELDPSRVAAQIVSGIGFVGGGLIFVRRDIARGLTTAATVWLVAAVGMACGAGLPLLAGGVTAAHFLVVYAYTPLVARIQAGRRDLVLCYQRGREALRAAIGLCTAHEFVVVDVIESSPEEHRDNGTVKVVLRLNGSRPYEPLLAALGQIDGVLSVQAHRVGHDWD